MDASLDASLPLPAWRAFAVPFLTDLAALGDSGEAAGLAFRSGDLAEFTRRLAQTGFAFAKVHLHAAAALGFHARMTAEVPGESFWERGARLLWPSRDPERVAADHNLMGAVPFEERDALWSRTLETLRLRGKDLPWDRIRTYDAFTRYLYDAGIRYPQRIRSIETAVTLAENRAHPERLGRSRPLAVFVANRNDADGAFEASEYPTLDAIVNAGYDVAYFESARDVDGVEFMQSVVGACERRVSLAVFSGHGSGLGIALGSAKTQDGYLDAGDFESRHFGAYLSRLLAPDADVFLDACATDALGLAIAKALPGRSVHGTRVANSISGMEFNGGRLARVVWDEGQGYVAQFSPPPSR